MMDMKAKENTGECKGWAHSGWTTDDCVHDIEYTWYNHKSETILLINIFHCIYKMVYLFLYQNTLALKHFMQKNPKKIDHFILKSLIRSCKMV